MTAPALRVGVFQFLGMHQNAAPLQQINDRGVRLKHLLAFIFGQTIAHDARFVHVACRVQLVFHPGSEIFRAVRRRRVDDPRSLVHGHIVGEHSWHCAIKERMGEVRILQLAPGKTSDFARNG